MAEINREEPTDHPFIEHVSVTWSSRDRLEIVAKLAKAMLTDEGVSPRGKDYAVRLFYLALAKDEFLDTNFLALELGDES